VPGFPREAGHASFERPRLETRDERERPGVRRGAVVVGWLHRSSPDEIGAAGENG